MHSYTCPHDCNACHETTKLHIDAWANGGCLICGKECRNKNSIAHTICWFRLKDREIMEACEAIKYIRGTGDMMYNYSCPHDYKECKESRWKLAAWKNGGCIVCGKMNRGATYAHNRCFDYLTNNEVDEMYSLVDPLL